MAWWREAAETETAADGSAATAMSLWLKEEEAAAAEEADPAAVEDAEEDALASSSQGFTEGSTCFAAGADMFEYALARSKQLRSEAAARTICTNE